MAEQTEDTTIHIMKSSKRLKTSDTMQEPNKDAQLVKMFCEDLRPYDILKDKGFQRFIKNIIPNYNLPSMKEFSEKVLVHEYNNAKFDFIETLKSVRHVAVSIDTWKLPETDRRCDYSLWTATIHFVQQGKLISHMLFTIKASRSDKKIASLLTTELKRWEVFEKVVCFITNNCSNKNNANHLEQAVVNHLKMPHITCIAAYIDWSIKEFLTDLKSRKFETRYNSKKTDSSAIQKKDEPFSWHYLYVMLKNISETEVGDFNAEERKVYGEYFKILKPLEDLTETLSKQQYPTLSNVIPHIVYVNLKISECSVSTTSAIEFKNKLMNWSTKLVVKYENERIAANAKFMDPRFKNAGFTQDERAASVQQGIIEELYKNLNSMKQVPNTSRPDASGDEDLMSRARVEVSGYVARSFLDQDKDPLEYWNQVGKDNLLYNMSQKYLCIPATVVPVQTISGKFLWKENFGTYDPNYNERRLALEYENVDKMLFLHSYYSYYSSDMEKIIE